MISVLISAEEAQINEDAIFKYFLENIPNSYLHLRRNPNNQDEPAVFPLWMQNHPRCIFHLSAAKCEKLGVKSHWSVLRDPLILENHHSLSLHGNESDEFYKSLSNQITYAFLSPIFPSLSKKNYGSIDQTCNLIAKCQHIKSLCPNLKIVALGGVQIQHFDLIEEYGFDGVALLGEIWNSKDPLEKIKEWKSRCLN